jgi:sugar lactone lactonase YvrE
VAEAQTPIILAQPTNEVVRASSAASFSVAVSGTGPFTYQWQFNGTNLPNPVITTVAGNGTYGYSGDGGPATKAELNYPQGVAVDASGNLFIADSHNGRIREVGTNGIITTVAGKGGTGGFSGDGGPASNAELDLPTGVAVDASGNLFIADSWNSRIRKVGTNGIITTVAGKGGTGGFSGDGGPATNAELDVPTGVAVDASGNLFIADCWNSRIRKVGTNGIITTVAGNGTYGFSGDGGPATKAGLNYSQGVAVDASGNLFIADNNNHRIREVGTNGIITTVAGKGGTGGFSGDGGPATGAELQYPTGVAVDASGNLFIADCFNCRIREVGTNGIITTVAGNGNYGFSGDGGPPTKAQLYPSDVAVDASGNLFIADCWNSRIREVGFEGPTLVLTNVSGANAGSYDVVVSSPYGSVTSSIVTLQVLNAVRYVNVNNANPTPPYTSWATAATDIQSAVDAAGAGDEIVVTNGVYSIYASDAWDPNGDLDTVVVDKPLTLQSVNGPDVTIIDGGGPTVGGCLYLTTNAVIEGFTLTNGVVSGAYTPGVSGGGVYCEDTSSVLTNCVLAGNYAVYGGGAYGGTLNNCRLTDNLAEYGSGAYGCTLNNCTLTGNSAEYGGGAYGGTLNNCTLTGNYATGSWGYRGYFPGIGGGAYSCTLNNCTVTGNSSSDYGGGADSCALNNSIVYFNSDPYWGNYDPSSTLNYCCTTPMPTNGVGNISADPQLASASHLSALSPCIRAGSSKYVSGTDIDGDAWANPPSIGCDEYHAGAIAGPLTVNLTATLTNVSKGYPVSLTALIAGRTDLSAWDFGDGYVEVNEPYTSHAWTAPGDYLVSLWAYNDTFPEGVSAMMTIHVEEGLYYVAAGSVNPVAPYTSWATAATNIQDAIDVGVVGGTVFVTNGIYAPVTVNTPLTLQSVNGPGVTVINGGGAATCVYLTNNAVLVGFTLTNGIGYDNGGGVYCQSSSAVLSNCVLTGNSAQNGDGGGAYGGTLTNCTLTGNSAIYGGGAYGGTLNNCTLSGNSADWGGGANGDKHIPCTLNNCTLTGNSGGGAWSATLNNCVVFGNLGDGADNSTLNNCTVTGNSGWGASSAILNNCIVFFNSDTIDGGNYDPSSTLNYCCTTPMPTNGVGNISADPQLASASHLSALSPCIGAGSATYASGTDIDGDAWNNPPSIGCDEYHAGAVTGPLTVAIAADYTKVTTGFPVALTALIAGRTDLSVWNFGDGTVVSNRPYASHAWTAPGDYLVALRAFNDSYPGGVSATVTVHVEKGWQYVATTSANPVAPYNSWATAATNIQDAVDMALPGGTIFVTNGVYAPVAVNTPLTVQSVNGPNDTIISGGGPCVYLTNNAVMVGFTLTNGVAGLGGGVYCESSAVLTNCVLTGNSGGGAYGGTLNNCVLTGNSASWHGGGAYLCTLNNCTLTGNSASWGGGAYGGTLNNCTLTGNSAEYGGGGAYASTLNNCIVYFNSDPNDGGNYDPSSTLNYCCTTPMPTNGVGNISADPQLASASHLSALSPCIGAGSATYASGTDIDGDAWNNPPSMGCDEYHAGAITGPLTVKLTATLTNVMINYRVGLTALIAGRTDLSVWDFGDGYVEVNEPYTSYAWTAPGDYLVSLWAYNDTYPEGVSAMVMIHVEEGLHYVAANSVNPLAPYTSWATAATNVQDAVNLAPPGSTILVTNGIYAPVTVYTPLTLQSVNGPGVTVINGGGAATCVYLTNNAVLAGFTLTNGVRGVNCESSSAVLTNCVLTGNSVGFPGGWGGGACGGTLNNCTLAGNSAESGGGGAAYSTLNNCTLTGNSAPGGGAAYSTLNNCTLTGNSAPGMYNYGGGAYLCTLNNCTLTGNSAPGMYSYGGGAYNCTLNNCIVYFNSDPSDGGNYDSYSTLNYCCTTPLPANGVGNITSAPLFVNYAGGNLHLRSNSPCINAANNAYVVGSTDLDGNPRIVGGTVDIGAYEYQTPTSIISYAWLQQYGLPINTNTDTADLDGTGMTVYQDWVAGLNPTNALSVLKMTSATPTNNPAGLVVTWESVNTRTYYLQSSTNLAAQPAFSTIQSNIVGQAGTTSYTDTNAVGSGPYFYRVGVGQ